MGQPAGQKDPQEAPGDGPSSPLLAKGTCQSAGQPVNEETQSTATPQQAQVSSKPPLTSANAASSYPVTIAFH